LSFKHRYYKKEGNKRHAIDYKSNLLLSKGLVSHKNIKRNDYYRPNWDFWLVDEIINN